MEGKDGPVSPFRGLVKVQRDLDDMFSSMFIQPAVPLYGVSDQQFVAEMYLPEFSPEDVQIKVQDNVLEIDGQKDRFNLSGPSSERFYRIIALPDSVDPDNIDASFDEGILRVEVPFRVRSWGRRISI
ncbi:MAG TPA: Hsp20/alpha crystallin family protein [Candidatus Saccharimonadales bacterium]|nr:Hsp20/alpha crystallin family protein [Candidatus Saccharimonadales bacterium]